jgi:nicotinamidase-related amidase
VGGGRSKRSDRLHYVRTCRCARKVDFCLVVCLPGVVDDSILFYSHIHYHFDFSSFISSTSTSTTTMSVANGGRRLIEKLKPETSVFLLCDIQERFRPLTWRGETVVSTSRYMTSVAKALDIPVVITQQYTKVFGDTVKDCFADPEADLKKYPIFEKKKFSMCTEEVCKHMDEELNNKKESVILFGIEAHVCVLQTCLDLLEQGKDVHVIVDAVSSQQAFDREIALTRMSQAGAFLTTAQSAAFMLMHSAEHPNFKTVSKLTVEHMKLPNEFNDAASAGK